MKEYGQVIKEILDNIADGVLFLDRDYKVVFANRAMGKLCGQKEEEIIGKECYKLFYQSLMPCLKKGASVVCPHHKIFKSGEVMSVVHSHTLLDGTERIFDITASPIKNEKDEVIQVIEILRDVTEKKKAEEALQKTEEEFRLTFENAKDAIFWADAETGLIIKCNKSAETLLEKKREEIIGHYQKMLHPLKKSQYYTDMFKEHLEKKGAVDEEAEVITKSGKIKPVHITATVTKIVGKQIIQGVFRDITERKLAEETLSESEERFRAAATSTADLIWEGDVRNNTLQWYGDIDGYLGYAHGEFPRTISGYLESVHPEDRDRISKSIEESLNTGKDLYAEYRMRHKDGTYRICEERGKATVFENGKAVKWIGSISDITERKQKEKELKMALTREEEEKAKSEAVIASIGDALGIVDTNYKIIYQNQVSKDIFGDHIGEYCYKAYQQKEHVCEGCPVYLTLQDGRIHTTERTMTYKDGVKHLEITVSPLKNTEGDIIAGVEVVRDVTMRKQTEIDLIRYGERLGILREIDRAILSTESVEKIVRIALEHIMELVPILQVSLTLFDFDTDQVTVFATYSKEKTKLGTGTRFPIDEFGIAEELLKGKIHVCEDVTKVSELPPVVEKLKAEGLRSYINIPLIFQGETIGSLNLWRNTPGAFAPEDVTITIEVADILAVAIRSKQAEEKLKDTNEQLQTLINALPDIVYFKDSQFRHLAVNRAFEEFVGIKQEDALGKTNKELLPPFLFEHCQKVDEELFRTGKPLLRVEEKFTDEDGNDIFLETTKILLYNEQGVHRGLVGVTRDITDRKRAEAKLREEKNFSESMMNSLPGIFYVFDDKGKFLRWNKKGEEVTGYSGEEISKMNALDFFAEEEKKIVAEKVQETFFKGEFTVEANFVTKDGRKIPHFLSGLRITYNDTPYLIGMGIDITDRKQMEETLRKRAEQVINYQMALLKLAKMDNSNLDLALKKITEVDSKTLGVERVSVWFFDEDHSEIICKDLYKLSKNLHEKGLKLHAKHYPRYFQALKENRTMAADDARTDLRTNKLTEEYLKPFGITSMLDVPIWLHGEVVGIVCHAHTGQRREWTLEEHEFAASIADIVSLALEISKRKQVEEMLRESEKKYRNLVDNALVGVYKTNLKGDILYINKALSDIFEYESPKEIIGEMVLQSYKNPDDRNVLIGNLKKYGKVDNFEVELITKKGENKTVLLTASLEGDDISGMMMDVTELRQAERSVKESETFLSSTLEGIQDGVVVLDRDFRVLFANSSYIKQTGASFDEIKGRYCYEVLYNREKPCYLAGLTCSVKKVFETGTSSGEVRKKNDKNIEITVYPLKDSSGKVKSAVEVRRDITRNIRLDDELKQRINELEEFYDMAIGRELKMKELKRDIEELREELMKYKK